MMAAIQIQIHISLLFLCIIYAESLQYEGTEFIFAFCEHKNGRSEPSLNVMNYNDDPVRVNISMPKAGVMKSRTSLVVSYLTLKLPQKAIQTFTSIEYLAVHITSNNTVVVNGFNTAHLSIGGFLALPVNELGTQYITVNYCQINVCIIMIVGTVDNTNVNVHLEFAGEFITVFNAKYKRGDILPLLVNRLQTVQLQSGYDLSGTRVISDYPVAVFVAADFTNADFGEGVQGKDNMVEQLIPISDLGTFYSVPRIPNINGFFRLKLTALCDTKVKITNFKMISVKKWQHVTIRLQSNGTYLINSNAKILVAIIINSWDYYHRVDRYGDGSFCLLHPVDMLESVKHIGDVLKIRSFTPSGKASVRLMKGLVVEEDARTNGPVTTEVVGLFRRVTYTTAVYSGNVLMTGFEVGTMMNLPLHFVPNPQKGNICADSGWVRFMSNRQIPRNTLIDYIRTFRLACCV